MGFYIFHLLILVPYSSSAMKKWVVFEVILVWILEGFGNPLLLF